MVLPEFKFGCFDNKFFRIAKTLPNTIYLFFNHFYFVTPYIVCVYDKGMLKRLIRAIGNVHTEIACIWTSTRNCNHEARRWNYERIYMMEDRIVDGPRISDKIQDTNCWILDRMKQKAGRSEVLRLSSLVDIKSGRISNAWIICQIF